MNALFSALRHATATTAESTVGALIEIRFVGSPPMDDVIDFEAKLRGLVARCVRQQKRRPVLCTDLRACAVLRPDVSERVLRLLRHDSPHLERNGYLGKDNATLSLQVQRIISQGGSTERRRMFLDESQLQAWLAEVTNISEQARLRMFLASGPIIN